MVDVINLNYQDCAYCWIFGSAPSCHILFEKPPYVKYMGYQDVVFQMLFDDETYRCCFQKFLHVSEIEYF